MPLRASLTLPPGLRGAAIWPAVAARVAGDAAAHGRQLRDAVVLLPYAALVDPLRAAFAQLGGWQPRVETALTLAAARGPADEPEPGQCSGDAALDRLQATAWLPALPADERGHAAALLADAAAALAEVAAARPPQHRADWWAGLQTQLPPADGPGALEAALLRAAAAWASQAVAPATDRLHALQPAVWYGVRIGGPDPLVEALLAGGGGVRIDLDPDAHDPFEPFVAAARLRWVEAADFEAEAWQAAQAVLDGLQHGDGRVALVALDRALVRRVSALLRRAGVGVDDETGWKLSTYAAAGRVLARLRAAEAVASPDERLDWIKRWPPAAARQAALVQLERLWRAGRNARLDAAARAAAQALWSDAQAVLAPWRQLRERPLGGWLQLLAQQLDDDGETSLLAADPAGQRLLQLLRVQRGTAAWRSALGAARVDLAGFAAWFQSWCEATAVQPPPSGRSRVVLTPLARAVGRPFVRVVLAGADARRLGPVEPVASLIPDTLAAAIGLATCDDRRRQRQLALAQLLRQDELVLIWRRGDGDALLGPGDDLLALQDSLRRAGIGWTVDASPGPRRTVQPLAVARPQPRAAAALPEALSASAVEALRECPYRFFARSVLRLAQDDELDREADKRDWGDWLHLTLHNFHAARQPGADDAAALRAAADSAQAELDLDPSAMLPFRATLDRVLGQYLRWLAPREAEGWRWHSGEQEHVATPPGWAPQRLRGRLDRVDLGPGGRLAVIDYKTTRSDTLAQRVRDPLEDTQLAYYAALLRDPDPSRPVEAAYLALDDADGPTLVPHPDVERTADELVARLADELRRVRAGAPLEALGEGPLCDRCEARGLCRRDQWAQGQP